MSGALRIQLPNGNALQGLGGSEYGNGVVAPERKQVFVAGDDQIRLGGDGQCQQRVVVGVAAYGSGQGRRVEDFGQLANFRQDARLRRLRACQD